MAKVSGWGPEEGDDFLKESQSKTLEDYLKEEEKMFDTLGRALYDYAEVIWDVVGGIPKKKRGMRYPGTKEDFFVPWIGYDLKKSKYKLRTSIHPDNPLVDLIGKRVIITPSVRTSVSEEIVPYLVDQEGTIKDLIFYKVPRRGIFSRLVIEWDDPRIGRMNFIGRGGPLGNVDLGFLVHDLKWVKLK